MMARHDVRAARELRDRENWEMGVMNQRTGRMPSFGKLEVDDVAEIGNR